MNLDFFGIPITGIADDFINQIVSAGLAEPEHELSKISRSMNNSNGVILLEGIKPELSNEPIIMLVYPNKITGTIYQVILVFENDISKTYYTKASILLSDVYGDPTLKKNDTENIIWSSPCGNIMIIRQDSTTLITFRDNKNDPSND